MSESVVTRDLPVRTWPVIARPRLGRMFMELGCLCLFAVPVGFAIFVFESEKDYAFVLLFAAILLPILIITGIAIVWYQFAPRALELGPDGLVAGLRGPRSLQITYQRILEYREFATVLEVTHETLPTSDPVQWSLARTRLRQEHWSEFTSEFKRRLRSANPSARIYDAQTGPPPTTHK